MGSYEKHLLGGGGGGGLGNRLVVNSQRETHQSLSTVAYPVPIK